MLLKGEKFMADYKGGEIFIDLGGVNVEITSTTNTNRFTVSGIYSRLETAFNLGKRVVITNYKSKYGGNNPEQSGIPVSVTVYRPGGSAFYIPVMAYAGNAIIAITDSDVVTVNKVYVYHNIYTPPETTTNNAKSLDETIEKEEKGEESR